MNGYETSPIGTMKVGEVITIFKKPNEAVSLGALAARAKSLAQYYRKKTNAPFQIQTTRIWQPQPGVQVKRVK